MKETLEKTVKYITNILFVLLTAPNILVIAFIDPTLQMMIAFVHALLNNKDASDNAMKEVINKID